MRHRAGGSLISSWIMEGYLFPMLPLLILFSSLPLVYAETHSHFYFTTVTNDSTYDFPSYITTRSLDDIMLSWYDSDNGVIERRVPWFRSTYGNLLTATIDEYKFQVMLQKLFEEYRNYMNDTEEFQVLQLLDGCMVYDDDTFDTTFSFHYNGEPFMSFSVENGSWIADDPRAQVFADKNNKNKTVLEQMKDSMKSRCAPHIYELLSLGSCTLSRKEQPVVVLTLIFITNSTYKLSCQAYGHYPKNISMTLYKNGEPLSESLMEKVTLPFPDITYLTQLSMYTTTPEDDDIYICSVNHISNMSPLMARHSQDVIVLSSSSSENSGNSDYNFIDSENFTGGIIGICLAIVLLVGLLVFSSIWWAKNRRP
ncbi:major histocompatibility complex class I-related gene protein-like [Aquarana catesbeiana]|uniref:major histocompatibility complex class I-related gene protein-like n=1 Tax=Aquarana catesbeiana TaxID=8400 RepID=UPI003CC9A46B